MRAELGRGLRYFAHDPGRPEGCAWLNEEPPAGSGYGIAAYRNRRLYGILRPSPESLHRVPSAVPVFLRNAREARQIIDASVIAPDRVVYFDLPDFEQGSLI